jgi:hypothetical protein
MTYISKYGCFLKDTRWSGTVMPSPYSSNKATDAIMSDFTSYSGWMFRGAPGQFVQAFGMF